ncbi:hypothetical protein [Saccharopolyspora sp. NPDC050642]|jgi:hypothetical protein|uniref:hypothetical protein n=1 Tax=Saccharopolyspora sp. NPDC050642 TaxID=3157099 RepID=UPI0033F37952
MGTAQASAILGMERLRRITGGLVMVGDIENTRRGPRIAFVTGARPANHAANWFKQARNRR